MTEVIMFVNPDDPPNGKGSILFYLWDEKKGCPTQEIMKKEFSINVWSEADSLIQEGKAFFKENKEKIIKELEEIGYKKIKFSYGY